MGASAAAAGGMDLSHKFSRPSDWWAMFKQLVPVPCDYRFFYISWLDVVGDLFYWRWLLRFAQSSFVGEASVKAKKDAFMEIVDWSIQETIKIMHDVPGLLDASHFRESGSVNVSTEGSGGGYKSFGVGCVAASKEQAYAFEPLLRDDAEERRTFMLKPECRFGECVSFTRYLAEHCEHRLGIRLLRNSAIEGFDVEGSRVTGIHTSRGRLAVDEKSSVVICGGSWSGI